jgi:hypothetical protein
VRQLGPPGAAGNWASAGTHLLNDKRGVPVAPPCERQEIKAKTKNISNLLRKPCPAAATRSGKKKSIFLIINIFLINSSRSYYILRLDTVRLTGQFCLTKP